MGASDSEEFAAIEAEGVEQVRRFLREARPERRRSHAFDARPIRMRTPVHAETPPRSAGYHRSGPLSVACTSADRVPPVRLSLSAGAWVKMGAIWTVRVGGVVLALDMRLPLLPVALRLRARPLERATE